METEVYVASAFSKNNAGGNKAGVVLQNLDWSREEKTRAAYQLGYSETAFLSKSTSADYKLEYYTPAGEVPLCGHATIGTFAVLRHLDLLKQSKYTIETKSGILHITIGEDGLIFMEQNVPVFSEELDTEEVGECFHKNDISKTLPIQIVSTGLRDIMLPIESLASLEGLEPDLEKIREVSRRKDCVGIHAFSMVDSPDTTAICRNFAPLYGIDEEAATGTSNCALACYLYRYVFQRESYIFEQGYSLNSVSRIYVKLESKDRDITGVWAGGDGYLVCKKKYALK